MNIVPGYKISAYGCILVNSEILKSQLEDFKINKISLDGTLIYPDKRILMCDSSQPMSYVDSIFLKKTLCIAKEYFAKNTQSVLDTIIFICSNTKESKLILNDTVLINTE